MADEDCDAVTKFICNTLGVNLSNSATWYPKHQLLQGLMLQLYQDKVLSKIRENISIRKVFSDLYKSKNIIANCDKVSYNPPVSDSFKFMGSPLHWDINFDQMPGYYIQGLVYLNDVLENRGPIQLIPGFHSYFDQFINEYGSPVAAIESLRDANIAQPVTGQKGDLILWLNTIPHAATANHSDLPRFVQYVSYYLSNQANRD